MTVGSRKVEGGAVNRLTTVDGILSMVEVMGHGRPEVRAEGLYKDGMYALHATGERKGKTRNGA